MICGKSAFDLAKMKPEVGVARPSLQRFPDREEVLSIDPPGGGALPQTQLREEFMSDARLRASDEQ
jgi:hypothetical protein